jgi:phage terminase large subunit
MPHDWDPRGYQMPAWDALEAGIKRHVWWDHRRSGKDTLAVNWTATVATEEPGTYWHLFPNSKQGRKAIWDRVDKTRDGRSRRTIDQAFPQAIRAGINNTEMKIELRSGSFWQVVGSDNFNSLVGANPRGVVFSEYALTDPDAWTYIRPILRENGGWAIFNFTARGKNHATELYEMACRLMRENGSWYAQKLTAKDTGSEALVEEERKEGMSEEMIQQEYYCSDAGSKDGSYYGRLMQNARDENRICRVPYQPGIPVETWWDLGINDPMSVWLSQTVGKEIRLIGYHERSDEGLAYFADWLQAWADKHNANFARHGMPHDVAVRELGSGKSRLEVAQNQYGIRPITVCPNLDLADGIENVRRLLPQCWFDSVECERGIKSLSEYTKEWDEINKVYAQRPLHNWASHGADAFRTMANLHPGKQTRLNAAEKPRDRYADKRRRYPNATWMSR